MEKSLCEETDFIQYLHKLRDMLPKITVIIAGNDTPAGPSYDDYVSHEFMRSLGVQTDLRRFYRHAYIAVIKNGKVLADSVSKAPGQVLEAKGDGLHIVSVGYGVSSVTAETKIELNGIDYTTKSRGLILLILDNNEKIIDACGFDVFASNFYCTRYITNIQKMRKYIAEHPQIKVLFFNNPTRPTENLSENEKFIFSPEDPLKLATLPYILDKAIESRKIALVDFYPNKEAIWEVLTVPESYYDANGVRCLKSVSGKYLNTVGGIRVTTGQPNKHKRSVYVVGGCTNFGIGVADNHTISSFLQARFNIDAPKEEIIVHNYGFYLSMGDGGEQFAEQMTILESLPLKPGDIVLFQAEYNRLYNVEYIRMDDIATRPHNHGELYFDYGHLTPTGYRLMADRIFDYLADHKFFPLDEKYANLTHLNASEAQISGGGGTVYPFRIKRNLAVIKNCILGMGGTLQLSTRVA